MASNYTMVFAGTLSQNKVITLPAASSVPGRIIYIKDICGNSAISTVQINLAAGDTIDKRANPSYALLSTNASVVKLGSDGKNNWMVLSHYTNAFGQPEVGPPPPPPPIRFWGSNVDGADASVVDNGGGSFTCTGPNDGIGDGWAYIYSFFGTGGSFTYDYNFFTSDGYFFDWAFEFVTANDPSNPNNIPITDPTYRIVNNNTETGTRTVSYGANEYVVLGVYSSDSAFGNGVCTFSSLPTT